MQVWVVCYKNKPMILCMPIKRKVKSLFPKWWCPNCHRYVLPDGRNHGTYIWPSKRKIKLHDDRPYDPKIYPAGNKKKGGVMREIRFRAWVPRLKKFYIWGFGDVNGDGAYYCGPPDDHQAIHQQFTGLQDRHGKEIYEGDIVLPWPGESGKTFPIATEEYHSLQFLMGKEYLTRGAANYCEVIGNIWENPELLKAQEGKPCSDTQS